MHCTTCNEKHRWHINGVACDYCGERCRATVRTHFGYEFGDSRYICAECIDAINDNNTDYDGNWLGYKIDRFGRSVYRLCEKAREEMARLIVVVVRYGGGKMCGSDDEAIEAICELENDHSFTGSVLGEWYGRNVVAVYGNGGRTFLVVPNGIQEDTLCSYADDVRTAYAHDYFDTCDNATCEICFG